MKWRTIAPSALVLIPMALAGGCGGESESQGGGTGGKEPWLHDDTAKRGPDDPSLPKPQQCAAADAPSGAVAAPQLRATLSASWDENWFASPALVDVDGDGNLDIVAGRHSVLYVWRHDGSPLWHAAFPQSAEGSSEHGSSRMYASPVVGDLNGDGSVEIAVGSDADAKHGKNIALYAADGSVMPGWPTTFGTSEVRSLAAADVDGDGIMELLANKTGEGPATAVYELDGTFHPGWPQVSGACNPPDPAEICWDYGGYNQNIGAADVDGDGVMDVISSYDAIGFGVFKGDGTPFPTHESFSDRVITSVEAYHELSLSQQGWGSGDRSEFTYSPPVVADIDGDGDMEYVLAGDHEHSSDTTNQGITLWVLNHDMTRPTGWDPPIDTGPSLAKPSGPNITRLAPAPSVGDLDGQPGLEIVFPAYDGGMYAFGPSGQQLWRYAFAANASPYVGASEALIVDLNGDGSPEVVFATYVSGEPRTPDTPAHLIVLSSDGQPLHRIELAGRGSLAAPSVADLDGDGQLELVISLKDTLGGAEGGVQIWELPGSQTNCVLWATGRRDWLRRAYVPRSL